jgi:hypothetical protein
MVTFRELEKEYKLKKVSKSTQQNNNEIEGKFMFDSNDDSFVDSVTDSEEEDGSSRANLDYFDDSDGEV